MGAFLPSEVARLVLGYLEEQGCMRAYDEFLKGCRHLEECRGRGFFTRIMGLSLSDILEEYCAVHAYILEVKCGTEFKKKVLKCQSLLEKVKLFVDSEDVHPKIKTEKLSQSLLLKTCPTPAGHKLRHVRSNSCDSVITIKTEKSYGEVPEDGEETNRLGSEPRRCHLHDVSRSADNLAEATNLADLPGNKRFSRCQCESAEPPLSHRDRHSLPSTSGRQPPPSKPAFREGRAAAGARGRPRALDSEEQEFRRALGLMKSADLPDKSIHKTPAKKITAKLKQGSTGKKSFPTDSFPTDSINVTTINALLNCTDLHERLAENINKLYNSTCSRLGEEGPPGRAAEVREDGGRDPAEVITIEDDLPQLDSVIKTIVEKTEKDPIFDQLLNEVLVLGADSSSDSDVISRPGTSTPEKSCRSRVHDSSPTPSWVSEDKTKSYLDDKLHRLRLRNKQKSIEMLHVSPYKAFCRTRKYPKGGKRMDILRENYRNYIECSNDNSDQDSSMKSDSPLMELHRDVAHKSNQKVIILSNEVVQTHVLPNNGQLVIKKSQETSPSAVGVLPISTKLSDPQQPCDAMDTEEPQQSTDHLTVSCGQPSFTNYQMNIQSTNIPQTDIPNAFNPPMPKDAKVLSNDKLQSGASNFGSQGKISFGPGSVRFLNLVPGESQAADALPPASRNEPVLSENDISSMYRRNVVTGKPPDIVISNGRVSSGVQYTKTCFSEEEIMKMPTIIMLPPPPQDNSADPSKCNQNAGVKENLISVRKKSIVSNPPSSDEVQHKKNNKTTVNKPMHKVKWTANTSTSVRPNVAIQPRLQTFKEVSAFIATQQVDKSGLNFGFIYPPKSNEFITKTNYPVAVSGPSACTLYSTNNNLPQTSLSRDTASILSNPSSEDDRFVIDEGQKIEVIPPPVTDSVQSFVDTKSISDPNITSAKQEFNIETKRNTPDVPTGKSSSSSTPRRSSHIRVLDFNTPSRDHEDRLSKTSPKHLLRSQDISTARKQQHPRSKGHIKSELFPTIPEKSTACKVMKPIRQSQTSSTDEAPVDVQVSRVWDDVQGMGQILKDESNVKNIDTELPKRTNKNKKGSSKTGSINPKNVEIIKGKTCTDESKQSNEENEAGTPVDKKLVDEALAAEWIRIRSINKKCWDEEVRASVSQHYRAPAKPKMKTKVRRKITKSVIKGNISDEMSKSTEDEGKLLENALNGSDCIDISDHDGASSVSLKSSTRHDEAQTVSAKVSTCNADSKNGVVVHNDVNQVRDSGGVSLPLLEVTSASPITKNLTVKSRPRGKNSKDSYKGDLEEEQSVLLHRVTKHYSNTKQTRNDSNSQVIADSKNSSDNSSTKESNLNTTNEMFNDVKQREMTSSREELDESNNDKMDISEPSPVKEIRPKEILPCPAANKPEPPVPSIKITPDMPREHDFNPLNAKCNLSALLETPFKSAILDLQMETPKFISPNFFNDIGLSALRLLEMPTPNFPTPLALSSTPRHLNKDCTPGSCSSRPTDYSSSSSYYKPDELDVNIDIGEFGRTKRVSVDPPIPTEPEKIEKEDTKEHVKDDERDEEKEDKEEDQITKRVLRPRRTPLVYYPQVQPKSEKSFNKNSSIDKCSHGETKNISKPLSKAEISLNLSSSSESSFCSTCSSYDDTVVDVTLAEKNKFKSSALPAKAKQKGTPHNKKIPLKNSPSKVTKTLQLLEEKRLRVLSKLNNCKPAISKKDIKVIASKKTNQNSQLLKKNYLKSSTPKVARKLSTSIDKAVVNQVSPVSQAPLTEFVNLNVKPNIPSIKSRRKSSTPRKLTNAATDPLNFELAMEAAVNAEKKLSPNKTAVALNKEPDLDAICEIDKQNKLPALQNVNDSLGRGSPQSAVIYSPKSNEEDAVTLHLSSDETESVDKNFDPKSKTIRLLNTPNEMNQIEDFIASSVKDSGKTPFQRNLVREGFDELSAKKIEKDLTDLTGEMETFSPEKSCAIKQIVTADVHSAEQEIPVKKTYEKLTEDQTVKGTDNSRFKIIKSSPRSEIVLDKMMPENTDDAMKTSKSQNRQAETKPLTPRQSDERKSKNKSKELEKSTSDTSAKRHVSENDSLDDKSEVKSKKKVKNVFQNPEVNKEVHEEPKAEALSLPRPVIIEVPSAVQKLDEDPASEDCSDHIPSTSPKSKNNSENRNKAKDKRSENAENNSKPQVSTNKSNKHGSSEKKSTSKKSEKSLETEKTESIENTSNEKKSTKDQHAKSKDSGESERKHSKSKAKSRDEIKEVIPKLPNPKEQPSSEMKKDSVKENINSVKIMEKKPEDGKVKTKKDVIEKDAVIEKLSEVQKEIVKENKDKNVVRDKEMAVSEIAKETRNKNDKMKEKRSPDVKKEVVNEKTDKNEPKVKEKAVSEIEKESNNKKDKIKEKRSPDVKRDALKEHLDKNVVKATENTSPEAHEVKMKEKAVFEIEKESHNKKDKIKEKRSPDVQRDALKEHLDKNIISATENTSPEAQEVEVNEKAVFEIEKESHNKKDKIKEKRSPDVKRDALKEHLDKNVARATENTSPEAQKQGAKRKISEEVFKAKCDLLFADNELPSNKITTQETVPAVIDIPKATSPPVEEHAGSESGDSDSMESNEVTWDNHECNGETSNYIRMEYVSGKRKKVKNVFDFDAFQVNATIVNTELNAEEVRTIKFDDIKELFTMTPDFPVKKTMKQLTKVPKLDKSKAVEAPDVGKSPLDLLLEEMSNSTCDSQNKSIQDIADLKRVSIENAPNNMNESETTKAIESILSVDETARTAFFSPIKYPSTDYVEKACVNLTKTIIEDKLSETSSDHEPKKWGETEDSPRKDAMDDLMNFASVSTERQVEIMTSLEVRKMEQSEKRKRQSEENSPELAEAKKPKMNPHIILKQFDIESVLQKLHP